MAENREEILANFQGITAIEDVAEAIYHLDEANWDLLAAINRVMPQDASSSSTIQHDNDTHDVEMIDDDISVITPKTHPPDREDRLNQASTSTPLNFNPIPIIELQVHCNNKIHEVKMPGNSTVSDLKKELESRCGVPVCRQQLSGLGGSRATNSATLSSLNLPQNAVLRLKAAESLMADDEVAERLTTTYALHVKVDDKEYTLKYPGTKTVQEVKGDIYSLTDIPVRHQQWTGWPSITGLDETVLAMAGLDLPQHELTVRRAPGKQKEYKRIIVESSDSENSSVEEVEDTAEGYTGEDDMFVDLVQSERLQPLMSDSVEDEALGCIEFSQRFRTRYGPNTPHFFEGTLQDAIKESCLKPAKERKLLGVYLHHEQSVLSNVFCAQLLGCEAVLQTLAANFIVYGWDLTHPDNNNMLLSSVANALGPVASMTIRNIPVDRMPALVIIMRVRSNTEIYSVINGNVGVSELLGGLVEALERFSSAREDEAKMERERDARQRVKREQDEAYQRSLEADRAKEEVKKKIELERNQELERAESERQMEEAKKEAERMVAARRVPPEPASSAAAGDIARIRVRLPPPHDHSLERRFNAHDTLAALLDFLASKGYPQEHFKVISSWPRRDLTLESPSSTLKALKLYPQETVMLEER